MFARSPPFCRSLLRHTMGTERAHGVSPKTERQLQPQLPAPNFPTPNSHTPSSHFTPKPAALNARVASSDPAACSPRPANIKITSPHPTDQHAISAIAAPIHKSTNAVMPHSDQNPNDQRVHRSLRPRYKKQRRVRNPRPSAAFIPVNNSPARLRQFILLPHPPVLRQRPPRHQPPALPPASIAARAHPGPPVWPPHTISGWNESLRFPNRTTKRKTKNRRNKAPLIVPGNSNERQNRPPTADANHRVTKNLLVEPNTRNRTNVSKHAQSRRGSRSSSPRSRLAYRALRRRPPVRPSTANKKPICITRSLRRENRKITAESDQPYSAAKHSPGPARFRKPSHGCIINAFRKAHTLRNTPPAKPNHRSRKSETQQPRPDIPKLEPTNSKTRPRNSNRLIDDDPRRTLDLDRPKRTGHPNCRSATGLPGRQPRRHRTQLEMTTHFGGRLPCA